MNINNLKPIAVITLIALTTPALAAGQWYQDVYGSSNYNGQVTLKDGAGNSVVTSSNPTGSNVNPTQSSSIQPPVVIVQATASLPIKAVGDPCTATTSGTAPNQTAGEGTAITADRTLLLSCQSGSWKRAVDSQSLYSCESGSSVNFWTLCVEKASGKIFSSYNAVAKGTRIMTGWPYEWATGLVEFECNLDTASGSPITACQEVNSTQVCVAGSGSTTWNCYRW